MCTVHDKGEAHMVVVWICVCEGVCDDGKESEWGFWFFYQQYHWGKPHRHNHFTSLPLIAFTELWFLKAIIDYPRVSLHA